jgi:hypothetical protein
MEGYLRISFWGELPDVAGEETVVHVNKPALPLVLDCLTMIPVTPPWVQAIMECMDLMHNEVE